MYGAGNQDSGAVGGGAVGPEAQRGIRGHVPSLDLGAGYPGCVLREASRFRSVKICPLFSRLNRKFT